MAHLQKKGLTRRKRVHASDDEEEERQPRRSETPGQNERAAEQEALKEAQLRALEAEKIAGEREEQIRALQAQLQRRDAPGANQRGRAGGSRAGASSGRSQPAGSANRANNRQGAEANDADQPTHPNDEETAQLLSNEYNERLIRTAGRRACILHFPFMEDDFLTDNAVRQGLPQIIKDLEEKLAAENASDAENEDQDEVNPFWVQPRFDVAEPLEIVREVIASLPIELGKLWLHPMFQKQFHTGYRKMRSESVSGVADARGSVFDMKDDDFGERSDDRKRGPGAKALFNGNKYMFAPAEPDAEGNELPKSPRWLRHDCLITACQVILAGLSAAESSSDRASAKARKSRGATWKLTRITPSILSFTSIVVHFVLSGDPEFLASSRSTDFVALWKKRMELLEKYHRTHLELYKDLERLYNTKVFPKYHKAPNQNNAAALGQEERDFEAELDGAN
ncbi:hypothetical protein FRC07_005012 [Ceratobasidium sp. 392]|nr:hypothetical protein FRC07_005012 [Ceratobasidium sp. 392]